MLIWLNLPSGPQPILPPANAAFSAGCDHYLEKPPQDLVLGAVLRVAGLRKQLYPG